MIRIKAQLQEDNNLNCQKSIEFNIKNAESFQQFVEHCGQVFSVLPSEIQRIEIDGTEITSLDSLTNNCVIAIFLRPEDNEFSGMQRKIDPTLHETAPHKGNNNAASILEALPDDILIHVALQLREAPDIVSWIQTCKIFHQWSDVLPSLWRHWFTQRGWRPKRDFRSPATLVRTGITPSEPNWRKEFISNHRMSVKLRLDFGKVMEWMQHHHPDLHECIQSNLKPATHEEIEAAEAHMKHPLANDMKEFVRITNGFPDPAQITKSVEGRIDDMREDTLEQLHQCLTLLALRPMELWSLPPPTDLAEVRANIGFNYSSSSSSESESEISVDIDAENQPSCPDTDKYYDLRFLVDESIAEPVEKPHPYRLILDDESSSCSESDDGCELDEDDMLSWRHDTSGRFLEVAKPPGGDSVWTPNWSIAYECCTGIIQLCDRTYSKLRSWTCTTAELIHHIAECIGGCLFMSHLRYSCLSRVPPEMDMDEMLETESNSDSSDAIDYSEDPSPSPLKFDPANGIYDADDILNALFTVVGDDKSMTLSAVDMIEQATRRILQEAFETAVSYEQTLLPDAKEGDVSLQSFRKAWFKIFRKYGFYLANSSYLCLDETPTTVAWIQKTRTDVWRDLLSERTDD